MAHANSRTHAHIRVTLKPASELGGGVGRWIGVCASVGVEARAIAGQISEADGTLAQIPLHLAEWPAIKHVFIKTCSYCRRLGGRVHCVEIRRLTKCRRAGDAAR